MDNLCHTLTGAVLGEAGLKRRTRYGNATLMIAANLPDLDVLVFATNVPSISFRRGWTHGVLAQVLLPLVLTAVVLAYAWLRRNRARADDVPINVAWILGLSYIGVFSHVFLDFLNTYGIRLLMPLDGRWFYGDAVFIIDPWLWLCFAVGIWLARRWQAARPARVAIAIAVSYVAVMLLSGALSRVVVTDAWIAEHGEPPLALMVGPAPITPLQRQIIVDTGTDYVTGRFRWLPTQVVFDAVSVPKNDAAAGVDAARNDPALQAFLVWSRFPFFETRYEPGWATIAVGDMRFAGPPAAGGETPGGRRRFTATARVAVAPDPQQP